MKQQQAVSVVVPTLNEEHNIRPLVQRIDDTFAPQGIPYEVVFIDDHSSDNTRGAIQNMSDKFPVRSILKKGKRGKAFSLLEGFGKAKHSLIAMIDADLQYPPEKLLPMYNIMNEKDADVVVTNRDEQEVSRVRKLSSKIFHFFFARVLFGINYDTQSGLKMFKKNVLHNFEMTPSPWSFDLEFIVKALENNLRIVDFVIPFGKRNEGITKVKLLSTTYELAAASIKLRHNTSMAHLRRGQRKNNAYVRKMFPTAVVSIFVGLVLSISSTSSASAISLTLDSKPITQTLQSTTTPVVNGLLGSLTLTTPNQGTAPLTSTPVSTPVSTQTNSTNASPMTNSTQPANATANATASVQDGSTPVSLAIATPASPQEVNGLSSTSSGPATGQDTDSTQRLYDGLAYNAPDPVSINTIQNAAILSLIVALIIIAATLKDTIRNNYRHYSQKFKQSNSA